MPKDRNGKFHPGKGKPSGVNKTEGLGIVPTDPEKLDEYMEMTDKYTNDADAVAPNVHLRHPNRNTSKGEDQFKGKENKEQSNKSKEETFTEERIEVLPEELPGILTKEVFAELADYTADNCISVFLNTHTAGVEVNEHFDPINFKNALQEAAQKLKNNGQNGAAVEALLKPGYDLLRNDAFWNNLTPGLAVFISDGFFKYLKMPLSPTDQVVVETSFYITPLIPIMTSNEYFYVLVISKKQVKLFKGDAFGMEYIPVEGLPNGLMDTIPDDRDDETTFRTGGRGGTGGANFHGIGGGNHNDDKTYVANYLEAADDVIWKEVLHAETAPLLLAGVEYLIPIYKSVSDYKHIWDDALTGSHEHEDTPTLYKQAREKMESYFQQRVQKALEQYGNKSATELTSSVVDDVIPATYYGRVAQLFVQKGEHVWGKFDDATSELQLHEEQREDSQDLIDNAVMMAILTGAEVYLLDKEQMPADSPVAAIMRY